MVNDAQHQLAAIDFVHHRQVLLRLHEERRARVARKCGRVLVVHAVLDVGDWAHVLDRVVAAPHAMQQRMAQMLRRAVDEVAEMQAEAQAEAEALVTQAQAEAEATQQKQKELLAEMAAQREALEADYAESKEKLHAELAGMRADLQEERDQLLADAKHEADHYREQFRKATEEAMQQRVKVLEQLMGVYRDLEEVPAALESAYQELKNPPDSTG